MYMVDKKKKKRGGKNIVLSSAVKIHQYLLTEISFYYEKTSPCSDTR